MQRARICIVLDGPRGASALIVLLLWSLWKFGIRQSLSWFPKKTPFKDTTLANEDGYTQALIRLQ